MSIYSPASMPEVILHYEYTPPEYDLHSGQQISLREVYIGFITINMLPVNLKVEECLLDKFLFIWENEIYAYESTKNIFT